MIQWRAMCLCDVHDVDVVAHSGAIDRVVVIAVHFKPRSRPTATCIMYGSTLLGTPRGSSPQTTARMSADRVEVPQGDDGKRRCAAARVTRSARNQLRTSVRVRRARSRRPRLSACCTCPRRSSTKTRTPLAHVMAEHGLEQADRAANIGVVVVERYLHGLPDGFPGREVDDGRHVFRGISGPSPARHAVALACRPGRCPTVRGRPRARPESCWRSSSATIT